jgi:hypothetical protein
LMHLPVLSYVNDLIDRIPVELRRLFDALIDRVGTVVHERVDRAPTTTIIRAEKRRPTGLA